MCIELETLGIWLLVWLVVAIYIRGIVIIVEKYKANLKGMNAFNSFITELMITYLMPIYLISNTIEETLFWSKK